MRRGASPASAPAPSRPHEAEEDRTVDPLADGIAVHGASRPRAGGAIRLGGEGRRGVRPSPAGWDYGQAVEVTEPSVAL